MARKNLKQHRRLPLTYNSLTRRMFLGRLGGLALSIPLLPSLIPQVARAAVPGDFRRAVFLANRHGGLSLDFDAKNVNYQNIAANIRAGSLANAELGEVFPSEYNALKSKMTLLRGLDLSDAWGHVWATALAGTGQGDRNSETSELRSRIPDSIDTLLSKSNKVYPNSSPLRILRLGPYSDNTHSFENHRIQKGITDTKTLFDLVSNNIVVPDEEQGPSAQELSQLRKKKIVDYALSSINQVRKSRDISAEDKPLLDNYADLLSQLQGTGGAGNSPQTNGYSCEDFSYEREAAGDAAKARKMCDILVAAMACGVCKIGTMSLPAEHYYVHRVSDTTNRKLHADYLKANVFPTGAYLMSLMDALPESNGNSMLENSCVMFTSDLASSKFDNHHGCNFPVFIGGGLNGKLRMGQSIDYQNYNHQLAEFRRYEGGHYGGRPYNELLVTILKSFGLQASEYSQGGQGGFGVYDYRNPRGNDTTANRLADYFKEVYLPNQPNRDQTLPYFYRG